MTPVFHTGYITSEPITIRHLTPSISLPPKLEAWLGHGDMENTEKSFRRRREKYHF
jgi:hypothetical protein